MPATTISCLSAAVVAAIQPVVFLSRREKYTKNRLFTEQSRFLTSSVRPARPGASLHALLGLSQGSGAVDRVRPKPRRGGSQVCGQRRSLGRRLNRLATTGLPLTWSAVLSLQSQPAAGTRAAKAAGAGCRQGRPRSTGDGQQLLFGLAAATAWASRPRTEGDADSPAHPLCDCAA
ncbi:hypothetical protein MRX96_008950 [Rhipicephalus microplus]